MVNDAFRPQRPRVAALPARRQASPWLRALLLAALCGACQTRGEGDSSQRAPAASSPPAVSQAAPTPAPVVKPFRVVARVRVSDFNPTEGAAPKPAEPKSTKGKPAKGKREQPTRLEATPEQQQQVEARLQSAGFLGELRRCYPTQVPADIVIFLNLDRLGKVTRSTIEGVPPAFGQCVAELFNGLTIPELASPNQGNPTDTLIISGVLDVQTE